MWFINVKVKNLMRRYSHVNNYRNYIACPMGVGLSYILYVWRHNSRIACNRRDHVTGKTY